VSAITKISVVSLGYIVFFIYVSIFLSSFHRGQMKKRSHDVIVVSDTPPTSPLGRRPHVGEVTSTRGKRGRSPTGVIVIDADVDVDDQVDSRVTAEASVPRKSSSPLVNPNKATGASATATVGADPLWTKKVAICAGNVTKEEKADLSLG
jgi:hypothetical protein